MIGCGQDMTGRSTLGQYMMGSCLMGQSKLMGQGMIELDTVRTWNSV